MTGAGAIVQPPAQVTGTGAQGPFLSLSTPISPTLALSTPIPAPQGP